jgi:predicted naringenin-chalcone synthase
MKIAAIAVHARFAAGANALGRRADCSRGDFDAWVIVICAELMRSEI